MGYSPWGRKESDKTEGLHFHFKIVGRTKCNVVNHLENTSSIIFYPLQYSCLQNPMDGEPGRLQSMGSIRVGHG